MRSPVGKITDPWAVCATGKIRAGLVNHSQLKLLFPKIISLVLVITFAHSVD